MVLTEEMENLITTIKWDTGMMNSTFKMVINGKKFSTSRSSFNYHYKLAKGNFIDLIKLIRKEGS